MIGTLLRRRATRLPKPETLPVAVTPRKNAKDSIQALKTSWKDAIHFLKRSRLKRSGHPLYVLPWHIVMGAPGSGKTTALRSARLTSFAESPLSANISPTEHVEWSFFEQAIVIDTAGRYAIPQNSQENEQEWRAFLDLLLKSRPREPFNGLTLVLAADQLIAEAPESLVAMGTTLRKRINELLVLAGYKFPVYLLVSKCDLLPGMAAFSKRLSNLGLSQAMGCLNDTSTSEAAIFLDKVFSVLGARLKSLRLMLVGHSEPATMDPALLLVPSNFDRLRAGLSSVLAGAFGENLYHETPLLRGLFFASGTQEMFLHEFFSKILPNDRSACVPTRRAVRWRQGTMGLISLAWLLASTAIGGIMTASFIKNLKSLTLLKEARLEYANLASVDRDFTRKILAMEHFSQTLLDLDKKRSSSLLECGLWDVAHAGAAFKGLVSAQFRLEILGPFDDQNRAAMATMTASSSDEHFSRTVAHLVDRLGILREKLSGTNRLNLKKASPVFPYLRIAGREVDSDIKEKVGDLYVNSVFWMSNTVALEQEKTFLLGQLKRLLNLKGRDPQWLIAWAATQQSTPPVSLSDEWGGRSLGSREPSVPGLFSRKGKIQIDAFFKEVEVALDDAAVSNDLKYRFDHWYRQNSFDRWHAFVVDFPQGMESLASPEQWQSAAGRMATGDGPYGRLRNHLMREFESVPQTDLPSWLKHVRQIQDLEKTPDYWRYHQALEKLAKAVSDPSQVMSITGQAFDNALAPETSLVAIAFDSLAKLKASAPKELSADAAVWKLVSGPLEFLWEDARRQVAEKLQNDWQSKVLAQATGLDAAQGLPVLLSKDGPALRFVKEQAAPFVDWRPSSGYAAKTAYQGTIPFTSAFFSFLNGAMWMSSVSDLQVGITALGPETNKDAKRIPHVIRLTLNCGGKNKQVLVNRRLRVLESTFDSAEKTFTWTQACTQTAIEIDLAGNHLVKSYPGMYGFFAFLHDFQSGKHTFSRNEFPEQSQALEALGVTSIAMRYRLKGAPDYAAPKGAPANIVKK